MNLQRDVFAFIALGRLLIYNLGDGHLYPFGSDIILPEGWFE